MRLITGEIRGLPELKAELARPNAAVHTRLARNAAMAMANTASA